MGYMWHVRYITEVRIAHKSFGQKKSEGKRLFLRPICRWEDNIKMGLKEMYENLVRIQPGLG
jgi:hypothetical protein